MKKLNFIHKPQALLFFILIVLLLNQCLASPAIYKFNSENFRLCNSTATYFDLAYGGQYLGHSDNLNMQCESVTVPNTISESNRYGIDGVYGSDILFSYPTLGEETEICKPMKVIQNLNVAYACSSLFNQTTYGMDFKIFFQKCSNETGFDGFQWINHCMYCGSNYLVNARYETVKYDGENSVGYIVHNFPRSKYYCGLIELGIPLVMLYKDTYVFACYCAASNMFAFRCLAPKIDLLFSYVLLYFKLIFVTIFTALALIIIPYRARILCNRNVKGKIILLLMIGCGYFMLFISVMLEVFNIYNVANVFTAFSILFTFVSLLIISINKYNLVMYAITRVKNNKGISNFFIGILFIIIVITLMAISAVDIISHIYAIGYFIMTFCGLAVLVMLAQLIWMHVALKRVSDINIFQTGTGKLLVFSIFITIILNISFSITSLRNAPVKDVTTSILTTLSILLIILILGGISIVEIDFVETFNSIKRLCDFTGRQDKVSENELNKSTTDSDNENYSLLNPQTGSNIQ